MKKLLLVFVLIIFVLVFLALMFQQNSNPQINNPSNSSNNSVNLINGFRVDWAKNQNLNSIFLIPNLQEKKTIKDVFADQKCTSIINASFYTQENQYLGLFMVNGQTIQRKKQSNLFNGFVIKEQNHIQIQSDFNPKANIDFAFQTGPILIKNNSAQNLSGDSLDKARRSVAALDSNNHFYIISIYNPNSKFLGPSLNELPQILLQFAASLNTEFSFAINLDGGSASGFINDRVTLTEISPIGSFLCLK